MAVAAKTLLVTERADPVVLIGDHAVVVGEQCCVVVTFKVDWFFLKAVAFGTEFPSLSQLVNFGMGGWHSVAVANRAGCENSQYND